MRRSTFLVVSAALVTSACGLGEVHDAQMHKPRAVQTWDIGEGLAANKRTVVDACKKEGASDERIALILAVGMGETASFDAKDRDASKDQSGDSANVSAFNVNLDFLKHLGWQPGQGPDLNDQANLGEAVRWVLRGMAQFGEDGFLCFHRGGVTAWKDGCSYGAVEYKASMREIQQRILGDRALMSDGRRAGMFIQHV